MNKLNRRVVLGFILALVVSATATAQLLCYPPNTDKDVAYNDVIQPRWYGWEYGSVAHDDAQIAGMSGTRAIQVTYTQNWGEYILFRWSGNNGTELWHTGDYRALVFRVKGIHNNCAKQLWVILREDGGVDPYVHVPITDYMVTPESEVNEECWGAQNVPVGQYDPNKWYTVVIPVTAFLNYSPQYPPNLAIKDIVFEGGHMSGNTVYLDDIWWVRGLEFPLKRPGDGAYDTTISAVLDHTDTSTGYNCKDNWVVAYTGEVGHVDNGDSEWSSTTKPPSACAGQILRGYAQDNNNGNHTPFSLNGQYDTSGGNQEYGRFLFYDGHTGYDYPATDGTDFYPVADGNVESAVVGEIIIDHHNGYWSYYLHNSTVNVDVGTKVKAGQTKLGETGAGHLHLTLKLHGVRTDPYGWLGSFDDPSRDFVVNVPLWK